MNIIADFKTEIDLITEKFRRNFSDFTQEELNFKPKDNEWSIAQIIVHIVLLNSSYFSFFREIQNRIHTLPIDKDKDDMAERSLITLMPFTTRDRLKRASTWDIWEPSLDFKDRDVIKDFEESQIEFKKLIENFNASDIDSGFIRYPGHANLIFKLKDCIHFLIEHEHRHFNQALEVKQLSNKA